jgi:hypothetical protein
VAHSKSQPGNLLRTELSENVPDAAVASASAVRAQADSTRGKVHIVIDDEKICLWIEFGPMLENGEQCRPGAIHEGLGLNEHAVLALDINPGDPRIERAVGTPFAAKPIRESFDDAEADVVTRRRVFRTRVAKPDNKSSRPPR